MNRTGYYLYIFEGNGQEGKLKARCVNPNDPKWAKMAAAVHRAA